MLYNGIGEFNNEDYVIYIFRSGWQGEMQWQSYSCAQLGIYNASNHVNTTAFKLAFNGSETTSEYYPMIMIMNERKKQCCFFEVEPVSGWYIELGIMGNSLYVEMNSAYSCNDGWYKTLKPGDAYTTGKAYFGCVDGSICDAIRILHDYKRSKIKTVLSFPKVIFNDYMNCLWAKPSCAKLIPLIDAAERVGCEVFCIDDGWYESGGSGEHLGDWQPHDERFTPLTFNGIIKYICDKGMIPGVWLEMECCADTSMVYRRLNHCLLKRNGVTAGGARAFLDFRCAEVREYTMTAIDNLYSMGIRYIKNDYNHNLQLGCDGAESLSEGYALHREAFLKFIDEVRDRYPDLLLESCSSGGMRSDFDFIRHMDLQSVSDQEFYYNNPSIIAGSIACIPPEHCGLWSYPFPLKYDEQTAFKNPNELHISCGREEIIFNMINSMLGGMYLSGHIECCNEEETKLIYDAVMAYKKYRKHISESYPIYITKPLRIGESGVMAIGLQMKNETLIAVWKINSNDSLISIEIDKRFGCNAELIYPEASDTDFRYKDSILDIVMDAENCARLFVIK